MTIADLYLYLYLYLCSTASLLELGQDSRSNEQASPQPFRNRVISDANASIIMSHVLPFAWGMEYSSSPYIFWSAQMRLRSLTSTTNTMRGKAREVASHSHSRSHSD